MFITPHMLVGITIASRLRNFWSVFIFCWLSHYLLDFLPHWDYLEKITQTEHFIRILADFIFGLILVAILIYFFNQKYKSLIIFGLIIAILPDFFQFTYYLFDIQWLSPLVWIHNTFHYWKGLSFWQGIPLTIIISLTAIWLFIYPKK